MRTAEVQAWGILVLTMAPTGPVRGGDRDLQQLRVALRLPPVDAQHYQLTNTGARSLYHRCVTPLIPVADGCCQNCASLPSSKRDSDDALVVQL